MIIRRLLGLIILLTALLIIAGSIAGAYYVGDALAAVGESVRANLALAQQSLGTARNTLTLSRDTFDDVNGGLGTAVQATGSAARAVGDSRPLLNNVGVVTTDEVPEAIEGIQAALPNIIQVAGVIDGTLRTLSGIGIDTTIPIPFAGSIPLQFDLGIDYAPATAFDTTLRGFQSSLEGLPESMRALETDLQATDANLATLAADLQATSDNLAIINTRVGEVLPLLDQYLTLVDQASAAITQMDADIDQYLDTLRLGAIGGLVIVALSQLAPLYLGWELLTGRRDPAQKVAVHVESPTTPLKLEPVTAILPPSDDVARFSSTAPPPTATLPEEEWSPIEPPREDE